MFACAMYWFLVITFSFSTSVPLFWSTESVDSVGTTIFTLPKVISSFIFYWYQFDVCLFSNECQQYVFLVFFFSTFIWFFFSPQCWLSRRNHLYIPRSHPTECVYCSAQSFCFLEKQNFLYTSFNLKEAMRLSSTHVMKMTWKQNKQSEGI